MKLLHLSDLHLAKPGVLQYGSVDTTAALHDLLALVPNQWHPDVVVVSGDISNDDSAHSYESALDIVGAWAKRHEAPVAWVPGNHDNTDTVELLHRPEHGHHLRGAVTVGRSRLVLVDTRVPRRGFGRLPDSTAGLDLFDDTEQDRVLVMHHPPLPAPSALHHALRLRGLERWEEAVTAAGVTLVLCGHHHVATRGTWAGADVLVGPAVANRTLLTDWHREQAVAEHGLAMVETGPELSVEHLRIGDPARMVLDLSPEQVATVAAAAGNPDEPGGGLAQQPTSRCAR